MENWIEIISFTYPHEAHQAKTVLEASEIEAIIKDEFTVQVNNLLSNAVGGVKILVQKENVEEAISILEQGGYLQKKDAKEKNQKLETFPIENKTCCPYCNSENISKKNMPGYIFALSILFLRFPLPFLRKAYYCYDCMKEWKVK